MTLVRSFVLGLVTTTAAAVPAHAAYTSAKLAAVDFAANKMNHSPAFAIARSGDALNRAIRGSDLQAKRIVGQGLRFIVTNKDTWDTNGGDAGANVSLRVTLRRIKAGYVPVTTRAKVKIDQFGYDE
jgi:hypothetical protein